MSFFFLLLSKTSIAHLKRCGLNKILGLCSLLKDRVEQIDSVLANMLSCNYQYPRRYVQCWEQQTTQRYFHDVLNKKMLNMIDHKWFDDEQTSHHNHQTIHRHRAHCHETPLKRLSIPSYMKVQKLDRYCLITLILPFMAFKFPNSMSELTAICRQVISVQLFRFHFCKEPERLDPEH